ncbi:hypothetical protein PG984_010118 [Apiospora sp. TS-2023a]
MRFSAATLVALLAGNALAGPAAVPASAGSFARDVTIKSNETMVEEAILFAIRPEADCSLGNCAGVVAAAACIAFGIVRRSPSAVIKCVSGGASQLCGCASCVDALGEFLTENNICS